MVRVCLMVSEPVCLRLWIKILGDLWQAGVAEPVDQDSGRLLVGRVCLRVPEPGCQ